MFVLLTLKKLTTSEEDDIRIQSIRLHVTTSRANNEQKIHVLVQEISGHDAVYYCTCQRSFDRMRESKMAINCVTNPLAIALYDSKEEWQDEKIKMTMLRSN